MHFLLLIATNIKVGIFIPDGTASSTSQVTLEKLEINRNFTEE